MEKYKTDDGKFYAGDCLEGMKQMDSDSITLGFTSPPYFNAVNYEEHVESLEGELEKWERKDLPYSEYKQFLTSRFEELYRITKPGGHTVVNLSPVLWNGDRVPIPFHFVSWMEKIGWDFAEDIVWEKPVAKDRRSGLLLQYPYPGYYYPSVVSEYVLVFQKPAEREADNNIYAHRDSKEKTQNELDLSGYQGEESKNVWKIRPVSPSEIDHPAPFPQELARRVIKYYSYREDTVIDIFGGSGQCATAAKQLDRSYIGFDTQDKYAELANNRIQDTTHGSHLSEEHVVESEPERDSTDEENEDNTSKQKENAGDADLHEWTD